MAKLYLGTLVLLLPAVAFAQSASTSSMYQLAIITDVKQLPTPESSDPDEGQYAVSMKVGQTVYVVLIPSPSPPGSVFYAAGGQLLVHVGDDPITWNDAIGQCYKSPIVSGHQIDDTSELRADEL